MRGIAVVLTIIYALLPAGAFAQSHGHSHAGQTQMIGPYEVELVAKGAELALFVLDDKERQVDAAQLSGSAEVLAKGNERKTVTLKPAGANKLAAPIDFPIEGKLRATVTLRSAQGEVGKGRYAVDVTP